MECPGSKKSYGSGDRFSSQIILLIFLLREQRNGSFGLKGRLAFKTRTAESYLYINGNEKREENDNDDKRG